MSHATGIGSFWKAVTLCGLAAILALGCADASAAQTASAEAEHVTVMEELTGDDHDAAARLEHPLDLAGGPVVFGLLAYDEGGHGAALDLAPGDVERVPAWIGLASGMRMTDAYDDALEALDRAEAVAARQGLSLELSRIHHLRGNLYFPMGNLDGCLEQHGRALDFAREAGSPECEVRAFGGLADAEYARGRMRTANGHFRQCIALCREHGFGRIEVANLSMLGVTRYYLGELQGGLEDTLAAVEAAARVNHQRAEMIGCLCVNYPTVETGNWLLLKEYTERGTVLVKRLGARRFEADCLHILARCHVVEGRPKEALDLLRKAIAISRETGIGYCGARVLGVLALATDDPDERKRAIEEGEAILRSGAIAHNHFWFYREVMEAALNLGDWSVATSYAEALEDFTRAEPLPWTERRRADGVAR